MATPRFKVGQKVSIMGINLQEKQKGTITEVVPEIYYMVDGSDFELKVKETSLQPVNEGGGKRNRRKSRKNRFNRRNRKSRRNYRK